MQRLMAHVARVHNGSFLRGYLAHPTSEIHAYYGFEQFVDERPACTVELVENVVARFYNSSPYLIPLSSRARFRIPHLLLQADDRAERWLRIRVPAVTLSRAEHKNALRASSLVSDGFNRTCALLALFGYRAVQPESWWFSDARAEARLQLYPLYRRAQTDVADPLSEVRSCARDGTVLSTSRSRGGAGGAGAAGHPEPLVVFWLGQKEDESEEGAAAA